MIRNITAASLLSCTALIGVAFLLPLTTSADGLLDGIVSPGVTPGVEDNLPIEAGIPEMLDIAVDLDGPGLSADVNLDPASLALEGLATSDDAAVSADLETGDELAAHVALEASGEGVAVDTEVETTVFSPTLLPPVVPSPVPGMVLDTPLPNPINTITAPAPTTPNVEPPAPRPDVPPLDGAHPTAGGVVDSLPASPPSAPHGTRPAPMVETGPAVSTSVTARTPLGGLVEAFAGSFAAITAPVAGAGGGTGGGDYHPLSALPAAFALAAATAWLFTGQARSWQLPASYIGRLQVPPG